MSIEAIYDFETPIEQAFATLLKAAELNVLTPSDTPTMQSARPRVDLAFQVGSAKRSYHIVSTVLRNASWQGHLTLQLITNPAVKPMHRAYRAEIRNVMAQWASITMNCHKLQGCYESSTTPTFKTDDGYEVSTLVYTIDFGIDAGAWAELTL